MKNSNFRGDHNSEDRWQPRWKFPWGLSGATDLSAYDPLLALAVASTRGDNAFRAEVGFSRHLNFRLFQQYRRKPAVPNDGVVRDQDRIELFWRTLRDIPVARQWEIQPELERKGALARAVNELNRIRNGGPIICEACNFTDDRSAPCSSISFAVLCPTCHRWAHSKGDDPLQSLSLSMVRAARLS